MKKCVLFACKRPGKIAQFPRGVLVSFVKRWLYSDKVVAEPEGIWYAEGNKK